MEDPRAVSMLSTERFQVIFNALSEAILLHDAFGRIVDVNDAATRMYGYSREEFAVLPIDDLSESVPPYTRVEAAAKVMAVRSGVPQTFEWHARRCDGTLFWVEIKARMASIGDQIFLMAVVQDITEAKQMREAAEAHVRDLLALNKKLEDAHLQVLQSEKMAAIGQLAAGVAHEINNPVGFVFSNLGSLEKYLRELFVMLDIYQRAEPALDEATRERVRRQRQELDIDYLQQDLAALLTETREGVNRVKKIVNDLKDFSRAGTEDDWQWLDLHQGLDSTLNIVGNELKYKTTVIKQYGALPQIYGLPSQLNQVFMNLLVNAAHAIETHGTVTLRTGREGEEVWVEVEDNGCGIAAENLKRIFNPFFTTKPVGKGTGLGLSVSYSIVRKHQGRLEVTSEVGQGTRFRLWLPIEQKTAVAGLPVVP